ncbi:MAG TPA: hypothetical protein VFY31_02775 [Macromonas sp.]|nr:hypothetical protein [Macromonas sp.]
MKLMTIDNSEMMDVASVRTEGDKVIVSGTIMGAMPIQAVISGSELRKGYAMVDFGTLWNIFKIFLKGKGA